MSELGEYRFRGGGQAGAEGKSKLGEWVLRSQEWPRPLIILISTEAGDRGFLA